ncbi:unnamed protein product [Hymenolepis diminuta]|uniref:BHLH domain-containing protein n=1 Tax=Hymenolepis diminuta TaxID=6216 RepID=A0A564YAJ8_HYMDI|nr:unnamed protein product [Hymenolepis diminuta]
MADLTELYSCLPTLLPFAKTVRRGRRRRIAYVSAEEEKAMRRGVQRVRDKAYNDSLNEAIKSLGLILPNIPPNASKKRIIRSAIDHIIELEKLVGCKVG